ncbi:rho guanine nucleotide exchange factor 6-like isoform X4 [Anneissia japonica]|uniref:rho guanine nucleotide exchange factor 6-like isoform X4 n=1 Tax=Anneissia japonica TaxID=1529436 RepID=UPI0014258E1D|nr:rho guanine nucleotide exchange factor 6-like isoform X4 [Anneissia japonica]
MATNAESVKLVRARFPYKGASTDELTFNKGDIIMVTQHVEGGWWEGTLNSKTGWFPSNYVKEIPSAGGSPVTTRSSIKGTSSSTDEEKSQYHAQVIESLIETEKQHYNDIQHLLTNILQPLETTEKLSPVDYATLKGNIDRFLPFHQSLRKVIEENSQSDTKQRIGQCFIKAAADYKTIYSSYCANHPKAVSVLTQRGDELGKYMESKGQSLMNLTTGLSNPFRWMDQYTNALRELERHTAVGQSDRIDVATAVSVYTDIAKFCKQLRKRKEMEHDIMTGTIQGWEGENINTLGGVVKMWQFSVILDTIKEERIFLLFPNLLVILSPDVNMSGFTYEGKITLPNLRLTRVDDTEVVTNAFEMSNNGADKVLLSASTLMEKEEFIDETERLQNQQPAPVVVMRRDKKQQEIQMSDITSRVENTNNARNQDVPSPPPIKLRSVSFLRPAPPISPHTVWNMKGEGVVKSPKSSRKLLTSVKKKQAAKLANFQVQRLEHQEEDTQILKVIEAYCFSSGNSRISVQMDNTPPVFLAEEEKIIVEETRGNETVVQEKGNSFRKSLVDTVYALRDQVKDLVDETKRLKRDLDEERKARRKLEITIRKSFRSVDRHSSDSTL